MDMDYVGCERYAREALVLMREIGSLKGILQSMSLLAQMTMLRGDLSSARALADELRARADDTDNLDGKMLASGLQSFLASVIDENYDESAALAHRNRTLRRNRSSALTTT